MSVKPVLISKVVREGRSKLKAVLMVSLISGVLKSNSVTTLVCPAAIIKSPGLSSLPNAVRVPSTVVPLLAIVPVPGLVKAICCQLLPLSLKRKIPLLAVPAKI